MQCLHYLIIDLALQVYRHPSCLIKHRWEHSPQWREASKFVLSKHQQVQLLEVRLSIISYHKQPLIVNILYRRLPFCPICPQIPQEPRSLMTGRFGPRSYPEAHSQHLSTGAPSPNRHLIQDILPPAQSLLPLYWAQRIARHRLAHVCTTTPFHHPRMAQQV